jgi:hypothetical protein
LEVLYECRREEKDGKKKQKQKTEDLEKWLFLLSQFTYKL